METHPADTAPTRATLAQVAERAGVSLKTASRALSGESYVSAQTRDRVIRAAGELDYQRNSAASLLASGRLADTIGLITGDFTNPFYSALAQAIEDEIRPHGVHLSVANSGESIDQERRIAEDMADRQTKALIVVSATRDHGAYAALVGRGIPVVFVDRPPVGIAADSVVFDNRSGGRIAATHLRDAGHERIAFIGDYSWLPTFRGRLEGMSDVLDPAIGDGWHALQRPDAHDAESARRKAAELTGLAEPPTAIVAGNNRVLLGVMEHLSSLPMADRPVVVGFDDDRWARVLGITVVTGDVEALGRRAAGLALGRLADRTRPPENVELPMRLVARASSKGERS
ncbi:MAG: LacI family DNA-binding transcriptional regulator [Microbacterium sp.]